MLATRATVDHFPGTVPAVLQWTGGDTKRLAELVKDFCAEVPVLVLSLLRDIKAKDGPALRRTAHRLGEKLAIYVVPELCEAVARLEDLGRFNDLAPAAQIVEELDAALAGFCDYLARKPWLRY